MHVHFRHHVHSKRLAESVPAMGISFFHTSYEPETSGCKAGFSGKSETALSKVNDRFPLVTKNETARQGSFPRSRAKEELLNSRSITFYRSNAGRSSRKRTQPANRRLPNTPQLVLMDAIPQRTTVRPPTSAGSSSGRASRRLSERRARLHLRDSGNPPSECSSDRDSRG